MDDLVNPAPAAFFRWRCQDLRVQRVAERYGDAQVHVLRETEDLSRLVLFGIYIFDSIPLASQAAR